MKNLICINTYRSLSLIRTFVWDYILFVRANPEYDFVVSLDGSDRETIEYCEQYHIPLIFSEANEGVGLSKNRVLETLPEYDHYFFIEDDVELLDPDVFDIHIKLSQELGIPHFSLFERGRIMEIQAVKEAEGYHIISALYGSAQVNFFTKEGLKKVGGFHTEFAKYKRFGHTEHSYRFYHAGLSDAPFQIIQECIDGYFGWHNPISRVKLNLAISENYLFVGEESLIKEKLTYYPLQTLSPIHTRNLENRNHADRITIDGNYSKHKRRFSRKIALLNMARDIKSRIRSLKNRNSQQKGR